MVKQILQISNVEKSFGEAKILKNITFSLTEGEVYGLVGQNGAGKTTLMRVILGLMKPSHGTVAINSKKSCMGYMPQSCRFDDNFSVSKTLSFFASLRGTDIKDSMKLCNRLNLDYSKKVKHLSPGQQKKLQMVIAMMGEPDLYILDEPTAGLDPGASNEMTQIIRYIHNIGKSILVSSHILQDMDDICTNVAIMDKGNLIYDHQIESSFIIKTSAVPSDAMRKLQNSYQVSADETATVLTVKTGEKTIPQFIRELQALDIDVFGVTASNVKNIVREHMDTKGDENR